MSDRSVACFFVGCVSMRVGLIGPLSDLRGIGMGTKWQVAEHEYAVKKFFNGTNAPRDIRYDLPRTRPLLC